MSSGIDRRRQTVALELVVRNRPPAEPLPISDPVFSGHGSADYLCGCCGAVLCRGMQPGQLQGLRIQCRSCGSTSRVPPVPDAQA